MPTKPKIRWRDSDEKEVRRLIRNFNAKVTRAEKKDLETAVLQPEKMSITEFKEDIQTRQELNRAISRINRYLERGSEKLVTTPEGFEVTKFSVEQTREDTRVSNIINTWKRKQLELSAEKGTETEAKKLQLQPKQFRTGKTLQEFEAFAEAIEKKIYLRYTSENLRRYKEYYLKGLQQLGADDRRKIWSKLEGLSPDELYDLTGRNPKLSISFMYDEDQSEETRGDQILTELEELLGS